MAVLSPDETRRYARHIVLKGVGGAGQQQLKAARVLVVGAGGLGSPAIAYLAAAGIGTLGIVDDDHVSVSNLQRQVIHRTAAIGQPKTESAAGFVAALNDHVTVNRHPIRFDRDNAAALLSSYELVLDGSDNFATRVAVATACEAAGLPLVSGAVSGLDGQLTVFAPGRARFVDLYPDPVDEADLPSCEVTGVLGPVTGVIGTLMAMEAIKLITGLGEPLIGTLILYDGAAAEFTRLRFGA